MHVQKVYHILCGRQINCSFSNHDDNYYMLTLRWCPILIKDVDGRDKCAVVWCSTLPITWTDVQKKFILKFKLGKDLNSSDVTVPISSIIQPLITFPDYGGDGGSQFFIMLPKRNWSRYFGDRIKINMRQSSVFYVCSSFE